MIRSHSSLRMFWRRLCLLSLASLGMGEAALAVPPDATQTSAPLPTLTAKPPQSANDNSAPAQSSYQVGQRQLTLRLPQAWEPLSFKQVQSVSAIGVLGAVRSKQLLGLVLVEPVRRMNLNDYAQALLDGSALNEVLVESAEEVEYLGQTALKIVYSGDESQGRSRYLNYIFLLDGRGYQVIAGGRVGIASLDALEELSSSLSITQRDLPTTPQPQSPLHDEAELTWQIKGGVFEDGLTGLRVKAARPWRVSYGAQLHRLNQQATVGLIHQEEQLYILFFSRPCPIEDEAFCLDWSAEERLSDLDLTPTDGGAPGFKLLGEMRYFQPLRDASKQYLYLYHNLVIEGRALEVLAWTVASEEDVEDGSIWRSVASGLSQTSQLDSAQRVRLLKSLYGQADAARSGERCVTYESWIHKRYHHFDAELTWDQPPGYWEVTPSEERAHLGTRDGLSNIRAPLVGLNAQLRVVNNRQEVLLTAHERVWSNVRRELEPLYGRCLNSAQGTRSLAGAQSHWVRCTFTPSAPPRLSQSKLQSNQRGWTYQLDSFRSGGAIVSLLSSAPKMLFEGKAAAARAELESSFRRGQPAGVTFDATRTLTDERFRYRLHKLPAQGMLRVKPLIGLGEAASLVEYQTDAVMVVSFAVGNLKRDRVDQLINRITRQYKTSPEITSSAETPQTPQKSTSPQAEDIPEIKTPKTRREASQASAVPEALAAPSVSRLKVSGLDAERIDWPARDGVHLGAILVRSGPLMYGLVAVGEESAVSAVLTPERLELLKR